jgi:hypothetical protein
MPWRAESSTSGMVGAAAISGIVGNIDEVKFIGMMTSFNSLLTRALVPGPGSLS